MPNKVELVGKLQTDPRKLIGKPLKEFIEDRAGDALTSQASRTPVLTGKLKGGWRKSAKRDSAEIANPVSYGRFQAFGTRFHAAAGFWGPGIVETRKDIKSGLKELAKQIGAVWARQ